MKGGPKGVSKIKNRNLAIEAWNKNAAVFNRATALKKLAGLASFKQGINCNPLEQFRQMAVVRSYHKDQFSSQILWWTHTTFGGVQSPLNPGKNPGFGVVLGAGLLSSSRLGVRRPKCSVNPLLWGIGTLEVRMTSRPVWAEVGYVFGVEEELLHIGNRLFGYPRSHHI